MDSVEVPAVLQALPARRQGGARRMSASGARRSGGRSGADRLTGAHDVLMVVDVQRDFCPGGALAGAGRRRGHPGHQPPAPALRPLGLHPRLASQPTTSASPTQPEFRDGSWPPHAVQGTPGAAWCRGLEMPDERHPGQQGRRSRPRGLQRLPGGAARSGRVPASAQGGAGLRRRAGDRLLRAADRARRPGGRVHRVRGRGRGARRSPGHHRGGLRRTGRGRRDPRPLRPDRGLGRATAAAYDEHGNPVHHDD